MLWELSGGLCLQLCFFWLMDEEFGIFFVEKKNAFRSCIFFSYPVLSGFIENTLQLPASYFCTLQNSRTKFNLVTESQQNKHKGCFLERWASTKFRGSQRFLSCPIQLTWVYSLVASPSCQTWDTDAAMHFQRAQWHGIPYICHF